MICFFNFSFGAKLNALKSFGFSKKQKKIKIFPLLQNWRNFQFYDWKNQNRTKQNWRDPMFVIFKNTADCCIFGHITRHQKPTVMGKHFKYVNSAPSSTTKVILTFLSFMWRLYSWSILHIIKHGLRTPNEGINQRNLKIWSDVADKICFGNT